MCILLRIWMFLLYRFAYKYYNVLIFKNELKNEFFLLRVSQSFQALYL